MMMFSVSEYRYYMIDSKPEKKNMTNANLAHIMVSRLRVECH